MFRSALSFTPATACAAALATLLAAAFLTACTREPAPSGRALYGEYCATCHGADAKGGEKVAGKTPPNLTTLARRHGGTFPAEYVMSTIDGLEREGTHGPMPIFGTLLSGPIETWIAPDGTPTPTPDALILLAEFLEDRQE